MKKHFALILIICLFSLSACAKTPPENDPEEFVDPGSSTLPERTYTPFHPETDTYDYYDMTTDYSADDNPTVTLFFSDGSWLTIELYPLLAPASVKRFIDMVNNLFIEGTALHSIEQNYLICGGAIEYNSSGIPVFRDTSDYPYLPAECNENGYVNPLKHEFGVIGYCLDEGNYDSVCTQFYICLDDVPDFDGYSPAFGRIKGDESCDLLKTLNNLETMYYDSGLPDLPVSELTIVATNINYGKYSFLGE